MLTKNSLDKTSSTEKSFFFKWILNSKWKVFQFTSLLHGYRRAEGEPLPEGFMIGTEMTPCDFNVWWQLRQSLLVLCMANPSLCTAQLLWGTALEKEPGAAVVAEAPELLERPYQPWFLVWTSVRRLCVDSENARPCLQIRIYIALGSGILLVAIPEVTL